MAIIHEGLGKDIKLPVINVPVAWSLGHGLAFASCLQIFFIDRILREHQISSCRFTVFLWGAIFFWCQCFYGVETLWLYSCTLAWRMSALVLHCLRTVLRACPLPAYRVAAASQDFNPQAPRQLVPFQLQQTKVSSGSFGGKNNKPTCFLVL